MEVFLKLHTVPHVSKTNILLRWLTSVFVQEGLTFDLTHNGGRATFTFSKAPEQLSLPTSKASLHEFAPKATYINFAAMKDV